VISILSSRPPELQRRRIATNNSFTRRSFSEGGFSS